MEKIKYVQSAAWLQRAGKVLVRAFHQNSENTITRLHYSIPMVNEIDHAITTATEVLHAMELWYGQSCMLKRICL